MMNGYWGWGMWGGAVMMVLLWAVVIVLAVYGLRALFPDRRSTVSTQAQTPLEHAQLRYSRGDISRDEYLALLADLQSTKEKTHDSAA